ncbi:HEAT repeat domain-containing protein [Crateriforma spongiae]|uniref:HEAT repeat domain-containing protein n=1 Tax=Crateriforma spongiae TaxID=2724528 RepID=UPI00144842AE|nr:HEAT repeat domain-containing protein [Crateriforma spongiae]
MLTELLSGLLGSDVDPAEAGVRLGQMAADLELDVSALLRSMAADPQRLADSDPAILGGLFRLIHLRLARAGIESIPEDTEFAKLAHGWIGTILSAVPEVTPNQFLLLQLLATRGSDASLGVLVNQLRQRPPQTWMQAGQILGPLMQRDGWNVDAVYPDLLDCLSSPAMAAPVLDLANFLCRKGRVDRHPAADQLTVLNHLLGEVSGRLSRFEEDPRSFGDDVETVQNRLSESVALAVSLCDAVGLIGDESSIGKLNQAIELKHRRVQCEAAGALARMDDDLGKKRLLQLTDEPAARLRAIQYADELGFGDDVDPDQRTETASAESEMALWLTQPQQMGVPPTGVEVIESRRMMWPSFDDPIDVHLVRFEYNFGDRQYSNIGIVGPVTFAMAADVADLPVDDIFAIYAGWHAEHDEIFTVAADQLNEAQKRLMAAYRDHLDRAGYEDATPELLGLFLDETAGIFRAIRDETECRVVTDGLETIDQPIAGRQRPLQSGDVFNLYKGRKMLRTFNPGA